jgi:glycosyltransferase involved in cell wall biosynthesis
VSRYPGFGVGCDTRVFDRTLTTLEQRTSWRATLGIASGDFVFSFVGRFAAFKGYGDVCRAFLGLERRQVNVKLLLVGAADPLHPTGLDGADEIAVATSPNVINVGWQSDVVRYLTASDAFVFPSSREGMPVCVMEALSMGLPVITRDSRGCRDVVEHGVTGLVLQNCVPTTLRDAMESLVIDQTLHTRLKEGALRARQQFDRERYVDHQLAEYTKRREVDLRVKSSAVSLS